MNEPIESPVPSKRCPGCMKQLDADWFVCPYCGLRMKPANDLLVRSLMWLGILLTFLLTLTAISTREPDAAAGLGVIFGLPLAYVFGKAVVFRVTGNPLTWNQLWKTSVRAGITTFMLFVVVPTVLAVALLIFAFVMCAGMVGMGR